MAEAQDRETEITRAMRARVKDFKEQADSLTLEGVRRMLEKDMGLKTFALDGHKRFIKQCLNECFESTDDENVSKNSMENAQQTIQSEKEGTNPCEELQLQKEVTRPSSGDEENMKESRGSVEKEITEHETEEAQCFISESVPSKDTIKKAIMKRASYFRANSAKITLSGVRRLLEDDLKLEKNSLDVHKSFINEQVDEVLQDPDVESEKVIKKNSVKKASKSSSKGSTKVKKGNGNAEPPDSDTGPSGDEEVGEEEIRQKKKTAQKGKVRNAEGSKKRRRSTEDIKSASNGRNKQLESAMDKSSDIDDGGNVSEDGNSQSSAEANVKKKRETSTNSYGKRVEHLKSVIKSCGMSVAPSVYKRAKLAPDSKREAYMIKELEEILKREGLSTNPSEKEIKEVKKKKERAKELEGIDMSNIVSSTRRRSTFNFIMPPKPKVLVESDEDEEEDTDDDDNDSEDASDGLNEDADDKSE